MAIFKIKRVLMISVLYLAGINSSLAVVCNSACEYELQKYLDDYRTENNITGAQMSVSLPFDNKRSLQPIMTFYSAALWPLFTIS